MHISLLWQIQSSHFFLPYDQQHIPAGFPSPANDYLEARISLDELLSIQEAHTYLAKVSGDSMTGMGIFDQDLVVVNRALVAKSGDVVIAAIHGEVFIKMLKHQDGQVMLCSAHPDYPNHLIELTDHLLIWGVVTHSIRMHRQG